MQYVVEVVGVIGVVFGQYDCGLILVVEQCQYYLLVIGGFVYMDYVEVFGGDLLVQLENFLVQLVLVWFEFYVEDCYVGIVF